MANLLLAALAGGAQGLGQGLESKRQWQRQKEMDVLEKARLEAAIAASRTQTRGAEQAIAETARQRALFQKSPADLLGGLPPAGVPWVPTQNQSVLQDLGPLASLPMEQGQALNPYLRQSEADLRQKRQDRLAEEDRARKLGPGSSELQKVTGFGGSQEELGMAKPFLLQKGQERMAALRKGGTRSAGGSTPEKIRDNIAVQEEYRKQLETATNRLIGDEALTNPLLADALRSARSMAAISGRPLDPNIVFDRLDPAAAASIRSKASTEAMLSTVSLLPGTAQNNPQMVQSLIDQAAPGTAFTEGLPQLRQGVESMYGEQAPNAGFTYGSPDTLLYGGPTPPPAAAAPGPDAAVPLSPAPSGKKQQAYGKATVEGITSQQYLDFRLGEGATAQQAQEEWTAYLHAQQATGKKPLVRKRIK